MTTPHCQEIVFVRWENIKNSRYYEARIECDLLGDIVLHKTWGAKHSKLGNNSRDAFTSYEAALKQLVKLHRLRLKREYLLIQQAGVELNAPTQFC
jgi:predicted DNA-binding WGR domain protein